MSWPPSTREDIERIVHEQLEESSRLEFKQQMPPSGQNDSLAKALAAMANTDGGIIIYGIVEDDGRATSLLPLDLNGAAERVDLVGRSLDEPLNPTVTAPVPIEPSGAGCLVIEVAPSPRAPHFYKGTAWARSSRSTTYLSRRQAGERFARSPGFAHEFGLAVARPGRLSFETRTEYRPSSGTSTGHEYFLIFQNDGEGDVRNADWAWTSAENQQLPELVGPNPFPIATLHASQRLVIKVARRRGEHPITVTTRWDDLSGTPHELEWPVTWG